MPWDSLAFPSLGSSKWISQGRSNDAIRWFFGALDKKYFELEDNNAHPLFTDAMKKLGRLKHDEIYGFVPALALGGPANLQHLQKVKAVEHLVFLAQLSELRVMTNPSS